jgi:hypothetical protein
MGYGRLATCPTAIARPSCGLVDDALDFAAVEVEFAGYGTLAVASLVPGTRVTETIYRQELRLVLTTGAEVMDVALRRRKLVRDGQPLIPPEELGKGHPRKSRRRPRQPEV